MDDIRLHQAHAVAIDFLVHDPDMVPRMPITRLTKVCVMSMDIGIQ